MITLKELAWWFIENYKFWFDMTYFIFQICWQKTILTVINMIHSDFYCFVIVKVFNIIFDPDSFLYFFLNVCFEYFHEFRFFFNESLSNLWIQSDIVWNLAPLSKNNWWRNTAIWTFNTEYLNVEYVFEHWPSDDQFEIILILNCILHLPRILIIRF